MAPQTNRGQNIHQTSKAITADPQINTNILFTSTRNRPNKKKTNLEILKHNIPTNNQPTEPKQYQRVH